MLSLPLKFFVALIIGAIIGLEREAHDNAYAKNSTENKFFPTAGVRTFSLITLLGCLAGILIPSHLHVSIFIHAAFILLMASYYVVHSIITKYIGFTTELAIIYAYLLGILVAIDIMPIQLIIALVVVVVLILSRKDDIKNIITGIEREEIHAFISFALIALVILPFLPNQSFSLSNIPNFTQFLANYGIDLGIFDDIEVVNPFKLWLIVALITGIDMSGYILERIIGQKKGRAIASMVGGFISSTATTQSLAQESKFAKNVDYLVGSAMLANFMSFFPIFILIGTINAQFLVQVTPVLLSLLLSTFILGLYFLKRNSAVTTETPQEKRIINESEIFALVPALKFAILFMIIKVVSQVSLGIFGKSGFFITSAISSFAGIDAITINISQLAGDLVTYENALYAFLLANSVNLLAKTFYSFMQGEKEFAYKFGSGIAVVLLVSLATAFVI